MHQTVALGLYSPSVMVLQLNSTHVPFSLESSLRLKVITIWATRDCCPSKLPWRSGDTGWRDPDTHFKSSLTTKTWSLSRAPRERIHGRPGGHSSLPDSFSLLLIVQQARIAKEMTCHEDMIQLVHCLTQNPFCPSQSSLHQYVWALLRRFNEANRMNQ